MSSGEKQLQVNPLERAMSIDIVRAQSFLGQALNEMLRALVDTGQGLDDVAAGGQFSPNASAGTPSSALIFSGFLLSVTGGSTASAVGPGTLGIYDPDATPSGDDSQYKLITASVSSGTLNLTANASGSLRIDVVECSRVQPDVIIETDSRDVFNTTTGLFAAATVNKVSQAQLQFRIRLGTPGGGFPGSVAGWLPLAVASVPTGTTVWDTVTIWDVRPLAEDLAFNMTSASRDLPLITRCMAQINTTGTGGQSICSGVIEAELGGRRVGGMLRSCSNNAAVTADSAPFYVDLDDAQNRSASGAIGTTGFNYVYLATPFGLPRWARYTAGPTGRVPKSPRGLVIASAAAPDLVYGTPHAALSLPPCLQNSGNTATCATTMAMCVLARLGTSGGSTYQGVTAGGLSASGGKHWSAGTGTPTNNASISGGDAFFTLTPGVDFPAHARAIVVNMFVSYTVSGGTLSTIQIGQPLFRIADSTGPVVTLTPEGTTSLVGPATSGTYSNSQVIPVQMSVRIPVFNLYGTNSAPGSTTPGDSTAFTLAMFPNAAGTGAGTIAMTAAYLNVIGWELSEND